MGLTLREGDREYYFAALDKHFPKLKEKYISRYGLSYELPSDNERDLMRIFHEKCRENGIESSIDRCFEYFHHFPEKHEQLSLF